MASGWAAEGAVQDQIDATIGDAISRVKSRIATGPGRVDCEECGCVIPEARRQALPGVRRCIECQRAEDASQTAFAGYNRRGSKGSQMR